MLDLLNPSSSFELDVVCFVSVLRLLHRSSGLHIFRQAGPPHVESMCNEDIA